MSVEIEADLNASATAAAANPATATLTPQANQIALLDAAIVTAAPGAVTSADVTITGVIGGTLTFKFASIAGQAGILNLRFTAPLRGSAPGQAIAVTCGALTNSAIAVVASGHQQ